MIEEDVRVERGANISIPLTFAINSASKLTGSSERQMREIAEAIKSAKASDEFLIEGHTCVLGKTDYNNRLSVARANFVVDYLIRHGIPSNSLKAIGSGPAEAKRDGIGEESGDTLLASYRKVVIHRMLIPSEK